MKRTRGSPLCEFIPLTFLTPNDYCKFVAESSQEQQTLGTKPGYWICKPAELSRGRGIIIFRDIKDLAFDDTYIVQKYICNPLLVGRYKCDLRTYVCVTGFKPLTTYIYQEGLVRFATETSDLSNLRNSYAHVTNSSASKSGAPDGKIEVLGRGCSGSSAGASPTCAAGTRGPAAGAASPAWPFSLCSPSRHLSPSPPIALSSLDLTF